MSEGRSDINRCYQAIQHLQDRSIGGCHQPGKKAESLTGNPYYLSHEMSLFLFICFLESPIFIAEVLEGHRRKD